MAIIRDQAVVLARFDYSETSQVIVLLTRRHGKVRAIAKGIKRGTRNRFAVGIDLLDIGHVVASSRQERSANLANLTEWKQTHSLSGLREKLFRIHGAEYMAEVTGHLTEDWDPHVELFDALIAALLALCEAPEPLTPVVSYQLRLLESIGLHPGFDTCLRCGRSNDLTHFSSLEGGVICRHCEPGQVEKWAVSPATLAILTTMARRSVKRNRVAGPRLRGHVDRETERPSVCGTDTAHGTAGGNATALEQCHADHASLVGPFGTLNYHIAHLMGREPLLASKLVPPAQRRVVE